MSIRWFIDQSIQGDERKAEIDRRDRAWKKIQKEAGMTEKESGALGTQVGGGHYKDMKIQPVEFIHANSLGYVEGCVIKYVSRWRNKNGIQDLEKAKHFIDLLIDLEGDNDDRVPTDKTS